MVSSADVVIIGAGIVGSSIAYQLTSAGCGSVAELPLFQKIGGRAEGLDAQANRLQQAHKGLAQGGVVIDDENNCVRCGIPLHDPSRRSIDRLTQKPPC